MVIIAEVTAVGGGTTRDLLLDRHPIFWIADPIYLLVIIASLLTIYSIRNIKNRLKKHYQLRMHLSLAVFTILGAQVTQEIVSSSVIIVIMAAITDTVGGLIRDVLSNDIPLIIRRDIYATAALAGVTAYLLLQLSAFEPMVNIILGMLVVIGLRLAAIQLNLHLPRFKLKE